MIINHGLYLIIWWNKTYYLDIIDLIIHRLDLFSLWSMAISHRSCGPSSVPTHQMSDPLSAALSRQGYTWTYATHDWYHMLHSLQRTEGRCVGLFRTRRRVTVTMKTKSYYLYSEALIFWKTIFHIQFRMYSVKNIPLALYTSWWNVIWKMSDTFHLAQNLMIYVITWVKCNLLCITQFKSTNVKIDLHAVIRSNKVNEINDYITHIDNDNNNDNNNNNNDNDNNNKNDDNNNNDEKTWSNYCPIIEIDCF